MIATDITDRTRFIRHDSLDYPVSFINSNSSFSFPNFLLSSLTPLSSKSWKTFLPKMKPWTVFYSWLLILTCLPISPIVHAWDPNEHQIKTVESRFYVSENAFKNALVYNLHDSMKWTSMPYQYSMRDHSAHFSIDRKGQITLQKRIDFEKTPKEEFTVSVFNEASNVQEYYVNVIADVFDENESPPIFVATDNDTFRFSHIPEVGTLITIVEATDKDTADINRLKFTLDKDSSENFHIDESSGAITVAKPLTSTIYRPQSYPYSNTHPKFPSGATYQLIVQVSDGEHETKKRLTVIVEPERNEMNSDPNHEMLTDTQDDRNEPKMPTNYIPSSSSQNDIWSYIQVSLQTPEALVVLALFGLVMVVVIIACISLVAYMHCSNPYQHPGAIPPNRVCYYGNGQQQPPSATNSQHITQSIYIYGDDGRLNNNRMDMSYMRP